MRDITYEAYKATVVLLALLDTLHTNCRALAKMGRSTHVMTDLAKKFSKWHNRAERLNREATEARYGEPHSENNQSGGYHESYPKVLLGAARKMNREARAVARFHDIRTKEMTASDILYYGTE